MHEHCILHNSQLNIPGFNWNKMNEWTDTCRYPSTLPNKDFGNLFDLRDVENRKNDNASGTLTRIHSHVSRHL